MISHSHFIPFESWVLTRSFKIGNSLLYAFVLFSFVFFYSSPPSSFPLCYFFFLQELPTLQHLEEQPSISIDLSSHRAARESKKWGVSSFFEQVSLISQWSLIDQSSYRSWSDTAHSLHICCLVDRPLSISRKGAHLKNSGDHSSGVFTRNSCH